MRWRGICARANYREHDSVTRARPTEDELIAHYFAPLAGEAGLQLKDDAARFDIPNGDELVITVDTIVAGVHFFADDPASAIGEKALGVNLSDLAAKGAEPLGFLLALSLPKDWTPDFLRDFADGLGTMSKLHLCPLIGGDTTRTPGPLTISITAFGHVPKGKMVPRTAAKPGDIIAVTGTIGDAALGLKIRSHPESEWVSALGENDYAFLLDRYLRPKPRNDFAQALRDHAHAAMDVSDGLVGDCAKMLRSSGVTGEIDIERVPLSSAAKAAITESPALLADAVTGGDDYEILCTTSPDNFKALQEAGRRIKLVVTAIGEVKSGAEPLTVRNRGETFLTSTGSYSHF